MAYFQELPNISQPSLLSGSNKVEDRVIVKNLFKRSKLRTDVDQAITAFDYYYKKPCCGDVTVEGTVETFFGRSGRPRDVHAHVPPTAASGTARPCRVDGSSLTRRLRGPVKTR